IGCWALSVPPALRYGETSERLPADPSRHSFSEGGSLGVGGLDVCFSRLQEEVVARPVLFFAVKMTRSHLASKQKSAMPTEQRQLAAIMFTDMVGYSALAQRDEALALELLEEHRRVVREILARFHGSEVKTIGDAFLLHFR